MERAATSRGAVEAGSRDEQHHDLDLPGFFPYQARVFYKHVSEAVARVYGQEYGMKPYEWRTLAILGMSNAFTPAQLVERSSMDKVTVSRAISSLSKRGWILSRSNRLDGRSRIIRTSSEGRKVLTRLVPMIHVVERKMLDHLTDGEEAELRRLMQKVVIGR
ncbi:MarR family transcriptional regulator [Rhizobiaceae bacterium]|nr:MarR family transcriptional regulator [Rhizobiaceae bacterium]